jgi:hypothetical protein
VLGGVGSVSFEHDVLAEWIERGRPTTVSPRRTKAAERFLEHHYSKVRVASLQFARRPQAGEAPADNGHVDVEVLSQGAAWRGRLTER